MAAVTAVALFLAAPQFGVEVSQGNVIDVGQARH
jgi:hypothetical protein